MQMKNIQVKVYQKPLNR